MRWNAWKACLLVAAMSALFCVPTRGEDHDKDGEGKVRAAIAIKMLKYVDWPDGTFENNEEPFVLAVTNETDLAHMEKILKDDPTLKGRTVQARLCTPPRPNDEEGWEQYREKLKDAHALYVGKEQDSMKMRFIEAAKQLDLLTVGNSAEFAQCGGMFGLINRGGKIRFKANLACIRNTNLRVSARLLELAEEIIE